MSEPTQRKPPPPSVRVFFAGNSGSGKTTMAQRMYLDRSPRVIVLDLTGEHQHQVHTVYTVAELAHFVQSRASQGRWRVALQLDPDQMPDLVQWLVPVPNLERSPIRVVGGAMILVDEVDLLAPQGTAKAEIRTLYRRSRHVGLSVLSTTQRPANVSREVSAQSTHAVALALSEPRDVDYMAALMRWDSRQVGTWQEWTRRHPHGGCWKDLNQGTTLWVPDRGPPGPRPTGLRRSQVGLFDDGDGE